MHWSPGHAGVFISPLATHPWGWGGGRTRLFEGGCDSNLTSLLSLFRRVWQSVATMRLLTKFVSLPPTLFFILDYKRKVGAPSHISMHMLTRKQQPCFAPCLFYTPCVVPLLA